MRDGLRVWRQGGWSVVALMAGMHLALAAEEPALSKTTTKSKDGLHFNVPADWPVEKRDGVTAPIPVEEYLGRKFGSLDSRLRVVEEQTNSFELRLRVLEEQLKKQRRLQSGEPGEGATTPQ